MSLNELRGFDSIRLLSDCNVLSFTETRQMTVTPMTSIIQI